MMADSAHIPVLSDVLMELLAVPEGGTVLDATVGAGGHAALLCDAIGSTGTLLGLDVDPASLELARQRLQSCSCRIELVHRNFRDAEQVSRDAHIGPFDTILFGSTGHPGARSFLPGGCPAGHAS
ncbi:MAG: 16S rRNA (cytosine(1402)-N(4))-methyltransferase [Planctomycetota bacterium]|jgi:16S rRNA (cytosine1402-N4)-methyltransferase